MATVVISPINVAQLPDGGGHFWVYMQSETRRALSKVSLKHGGL